MFDNIFDFDFEFDIVALVWTVILSAAFIAMVWTIPTWRTYPLRNKIIITAALPFISYFIVVWQKNR